MKMSTRVWARFESVGKPLSTWMTPENGMEVGKAMLELARWMQGVYMGSHIRITFARSLEELEAATQGKRTSQVNEDMLSQLESLISQETLDFEEDPEPALPIDGKED